jgi:secreted protein with Ig-like and vWFA domain
MNMSTTNHNGDEFSRDEITPEEIAAAQVTAYALGQLQGEERADVERRLAASGDGALARDIVEIEALAGVVSLTRSTEPLPQADSALRERLKRALEANAQKVELPKRTSYRALVWLGVGAAPAVVLAALILPAIQSNRLAARRMESSNDIGKIKSGFDVTTGVPQAASVDSRGYAELREEMTRAEKLPNGMPDLAFGGRFQRSVSEAEAVWQASGQREVDERTTRGVRIADPEARAVPNMFGDMAAAAPQQLPQLRNPTLQSGSQSAARNPGGNAIVFNSNPADEWDAITARREKYKSIDLGKEQPGTEQYQPIVENAFLSPLQQPLSTFSIDVDTASYANMRRFLTSGRLPPRNSVRIEELVNYFRYEYPQPKGEQPFSVNMEMAQCPWRDKHLLLRVGLKGKEIQRSQRPASNLVFLLDVSGSMSDENKLPLLKTAMKMLVGELGENDRVSIVTYAGDAGLKLKSTTGDQQKRITQTIDSLSAGGSTNGSAGIELAYEQATDNFIKGGTNRVILCTDGDLNVGITSDEALTRLIKEKAKSGVFLTVLGFGEGNLKDAKMERIADNGNGLYAYIDSVREARKVLVEQLTGSTITIAKDVKIQIEFNPAQIAAYRLLGYENRVLAAEDFNNDKKDAGEIGAGHTVTALYELVPVGAEVESQPVRPDVDELKYQADVQSPKSKVQGREDRTPTGGAASGELLTLKLRYKEPEGETSKLIEYPLKDRGGSFHSASSDMQFAAAVASFGMILRQSQYRGNATLDAVAEIASRALGKDEGGYRAEFVDLVRKAQALDAR